MATINEIRQGIIDNLSTIYGLRAAAVVPEAPNPPVAIVELSSGSYDTTFGRGLDSWQFTVTLIVGRSDNRAAQISLDEFVASSGGRSVKQAIESNKTLGGFASDCRVTNLNSYGQITLGDTTYSGAEFAVSVWAN
jgi:hypothetical protein